MILNPVVNQITIYPVKSLEGISLQKAQIGTGGCLIHDREYAITDSNGKFVKGKNNSLVYLLRSSVDIDNQIISFRQESAATWNSFHLQKDKTAIDEFLSAYFGMKVTLVRDTAGEFLDVPVKSGITVLSNASLKTVGTWFGHMHMDETRKRFRANIELSGVPAFWEDNLFWKPGTAVAFKIGTVICMGLSPRERCVVPTRHPETGEMIHAFQKSFAQQRLANMPTWSTLDDYNHGYYLSVDCYIPASEFGKWIAIGDEVSIIGKKITA
jgi:uncharacterized protein YcbX